jgi:glycosyltransferase involved in cell wall biosynthesis
MRLLIVTQYFPPEIGAPQARLYELAMRLQGRGHAVSVLTAMPNYPTGRVFDGYRRRICSEERMDGMRVVRTCLYPSKSSRILPRLFSYLTFIASSLILGWWDLGKQDIVIIESPPLFLVPAGLWIGQMTGARSVMFVSDIWPGSLLTDNIPKGPLLSMTYWLERFCYEHSDVVALTNPGAIPDIAGRFPQVTTTVISNGVDTGLFRPELRSNRVREELGAGPEDFLAGYFGLHGTAQGLETVVRAAERLQGHGRIKFVMIGDGPCKDDLAAMVREKGLSNVRFFPPRPKREIPAILASCDCSLIPLHKRMPGTMPSKTYEALAAGVPAIVAKGCEAEKLVNQFHTGLAYEPGDDADFAEAMRYLAEHSEEVGTIRANCLRLAKRFDRDVIAERTEALLVALAEGRPLPEVVW